MASRSGSLNIMMAATSWPHDESDWRGRFILDIHTALAGLVGVELSLWSPPGVSPSHGIYSVTPEEAVWLKRMSERGGIAHILRTNPLSGVYFAAGILQRLRAACRRSPPDIYHINWMQLALGLANDGRPALISVLGSDFGLLRLPGMRLLLRKAFRRRKVCLAPNAEWMVDPLVKYFGDVAEVKANPFGVDSSLLAVSRQKQPDTHEWLVVSRVTQQKLGDLPLWGRGLFENKRHIRLLGPMQESINLPAWVDYCGATNPKQLRESYFPNAAGLLTLSRHDEGRPQVIIEAMAAGLPIIASDIPAHRNVIIHGKTGWLVNTREDLIVALEQAEDPNKSLRTGQQARKWVIDRLGTWDDHAERCYKIYKYLLED